MTRILSKPTAKTFTVEDPDGNWVVGFRQLTKGDYIDLGDLEGKRDILYDPDGNFLGYRVINNRARSERRGIYRTMTECDLAWADGTLIFESKDGLVSKAMTEQKFNQNYDLLSNAFADKIVEKFEEINPTLNATGE